MAELIRVTDAADPRLADYRDLRDVSLRKSLEAEHGLFLAEGEKVVRRALEAGHTARSFLMAERWLDGLADANDLHCHWVRGHNDHPENEQADRLAVEAVKRYTGRD